MTDASGTAAPELSVIVPVSVAVTVWPKPQGAAPIRAIARSVTIILNCVAILLNPLNPDKTEDDAFWDDPKRAQPTICGIRSQGTSSRDRSCNEKILHGGSRPLPVGHPTDAFNCARFYMIASWWSIVARPLPG